MGIFELIKWIWEQFEQFIFPFVIIHVYERGVMVTFGKNPQLLQPGFRLKWPFIQQIFTENVMPDTLCPKAVHTTTLDGKTISIEPVVEYTIDDPLKWILAANDAKTNLYDILRGVVSDLITDMNWEDVKKKPTLTKIKNKLEEKTSYMGIKIKSVMLVDMCISRIFITQV